MQDRLVGVRPETASPPPSRRARVLLALSAAILSGFKAYQSSLGDPKPRDFDQVWYAAHALLAGRDPYAEIGPGLAFEWTDRFFYPLTAALGVMPLIPFPHMLAASLFAGLAAGAFVWAATQRSLAPAVVITSASAAMAAEVVQWSPLLGAAFGIPLLGMFLSAKPTIGVAIFAARPTRTALIGIALLGGVSLLVQPSWVAAWIGAVHHTSLLQPGGTPYLSPILTPGGFTVVLLLARWRRPEARLVMALACVPQTPLVYETVPLFLVPQTLVEAGVLWLGSWLAVLWSLVGGPYASRLARFTVSASAIGWTMYLPCVLMILRRPNQGELPRLLERWIARSRLPAFLRGSPLPEA